ncbi:hypothetical protein Tco_0567776 [Tanacetum coccineum]
MPPKRTSTSATPAMTQDAIRKLVADIIAAILEEVANITQRLMDQVLKHGSVQGTRASPVARAPYKLVPLEMQELSN